MNKIEQMLQELCPEGVEYKKLGEVCEIQRGVRVTKQQLSMNGAYPVYQNSLIPLGRYDKSNQPAGTPFVIIGGAAGDIAYSDVDFWAADDCLCVECLGNINSKYVYYCLINKQHVLKRQVRKASVPRLSRSAVESFEIPIPPLPIQKEIVRILDHFTELTASLQAELQARQEQYEYYRNKLLMFTKNGGGTQSVTWMKMSEICAKIISGGTPNTSKKEYYNGNIPWLRTQEIDWCNIYNTSIKITKEGLENSSAKMIPINCVIVAMYGATAAKVAVNKIPLCTNQACCNLEINPQMADYRFVYQWMCKEYENLKAKGEGSQHNINSKKIKDYLIPVPSLSEQQRIVSILDKFETLVNDLSQGLPAEIAAVQEQYEYYRNKLLTFNPKTTNRNERL